MKNLTLENIARACSSELKNAGGNETREIPSVREMKSFVLKELMNLKDMALAKEDESEFPLYIECGRFIFRCCNDGYMSAIFAPESVNSFEYLEDGE